jgi:hypothetical protein
MELDFKDFYIGYENHPRFTVNKIIVDDLVRIIIQKYEMIIFTNKGEVYGDNNFGADLLRLLYETKISSDSVKSIIIEQINNYIPELSGFNYTLEVEFKNDPERHQDVMIIDFKFSGYEVNAVII